ncbi:MAG TPA: NifU family protein [Candidatus Megaira endosymbiont of Nemacystus decipiens]|nr:NifU family protein [Candidatus Megaera endosymbiont of Nemacystus decipiens]
MFIQTEETPNPNALKFLPEAEINLKEPIFFHTKEDAIGKSPMALKLFDVHGVKSVFFGNNFITITKNEEENWELIKPDILMSIMDHLVSGMPIFEENSQSIDDNSSDISEIEKQIIEIIDTRVRPSVAMDGGDITYKGFKNGIVYLQLRGACSGCPSSSITLKNGIESMLQHFIPEVKAVEAFGE